MKDEQQPDLAVSNACGELAELLKEAGAVVRFGLRHQGHLPTVERMRSEGASWAEIGHAIGWEATAVQRCYRVETNPRHVNACRPSEEMTDAEVIDALVYCAESWDPNARLHANLRAGDIVRALVALAEAVQGYVRERDEAYGYLSRLFLACAPQCEVLPTLTGVATQIDNLIEGLRYERDEARAEIARLTTELGDAEQQLEVLRPGGTYAWKTRAEAAEQREQALRDENAQWKSANRLAEEAMARALKRAATYASELGSERAANEALRDGLREVQDAIRRVGFTPYPYAVLEAIDALLTAPAATPEAKCNHRYAYVQASDTYVCLECGDMFTSYDVHAAGGSRRDGELPAATPGQEPKA